jgi:hypothetical protein
MKVFANIVLILILVTIVVPVGYLAWHAGQPMDLPQFKGLTYYKYLYWRKGALHQMAVEYQAAHPNAKMSGGLDACFNVDTLGDLGLKLPLAGFYAMAGIYPSLQQHIQKSDLQYVPQGVTWWTFLLNWWRTYESFVWDSASYAPDTSVAYCRLQPNIPSSVSVNP